MVAVALSPLAVALMVMAVVVGLLGLRGKLQEGKAINPGGAEQVLGIGGRFQKLERQLGGVAQGVRVPLQGPM